MDWSSESKKDSIHQEQEEEEEEGPLPRRNLLLLPFAYDKRGCKRKMGEFRALYKRRFLAYRGVIVPSSSCET